MRITLDRILQLLKTGVSNTEGMIALDLIERSDETGVAVFDASELRKRHSMSISAFSHALSRIEKKGAITRINRNKVKINIA